MKPHGTIFVVDDDDALRRANQRLLRECGYEVRGCASAEEFLDAYVPGTKGCILLDVRMPGASGLELQALLRGRGDLLPIVFLTGHASPPARAQALAAGATAFLEKPVGLAALLDALDRALDPGCPSAE